MRAVWRESVEGEEIGLKRGFGERERLEKKEG
jgi:hypothetical protein